MAGLLVAVINGVMAGSHSVLSRKVIRQLATSTSDESRWGYLENATVLEFQIFVIAAGGLLLTLPIVPFILPAYAPCLPMVAPLLAGHIAMRSRNHFGVYLKYSEKFLAIHAGHAIHLAIVVTIAFAALHTGRPEGVLLGQATGATAGTLLVGFWIWKTLRFPGQLFRLLRLFLQMALAGLWLLASPFGADIVFHLIFAAGGASLLLLFSFILFPGSRSDLWAVIRGGKNKAAGPT